MPPLHPVIALVGPTCSGKTALSLSLAEKLGGEIVACDSRTIYKRMNLGTAKPTALEQKRAPHHMIDLLEPDRFYSVAEYKERADEIMLEIFERSAVPIVCGGTGLYARALLEGIGIPSVPPQVEMRRELVLLAERDGNTALHAVLQEIDSVTAERLNANDRVRIIRAIEVSKVAGKPFSDLIFKAEPNYETLWIGLFWRERQKQRLAISNRFDMQLEDGLLEEVKALAHEKAFEPVLRRAVNYKEFFPLLEGKSSLESVRTECILHNFQLSRKQMVWFRANKQINWFAVDEFSIEEICRKVLEIFPNDSRPRP
jgi:tRNA dimethylallyltransferase